MWVVPEAKQATNTFNTVLKYSAVCVIVTLIFVFIRGNQLNSSSSSAQTQAQYDCDEVARFPDPTTNVNCFRSYVLCMADDDWKSYSCPLGTRFSAIENRCASDPETEKECLYPGDDTELRELVSDKMTATFSCPSAGVFRNDFSGTCEDYILCVNTIQEQLYAIYLHCGSDQFFSAEHSACIERASHICDFEGHLHLINHTAVSTAATPSALEQTTTTTAPETPELETTTDEIPQLMTTHSTIVLETTTAKITTTTMETEIPEITLSTLTTQSFTTIRPNESETSWTNAGDESDEVEVIDPQSETIKYPEAIPSFVFNCTKAGRFARPFGSDSDPRFYILCTHFLDRIQGYLFECPAKTVFSQEQMRCTRNIPNVIESTTTTKGPETTKISQETTEMEITTQIADISSKVTDPPITTEQTTAVTTELPIQSSTISTTTQTTTEPSTTLSPTTPKAELVTETTSTTTSTTHKPQEIFQNLETPLCLQPGRFHNEYTLDCRSYLLCSPQSSSGDLIGSYFRCPKDSKFSDALGHCVRSYDCPYYHCTSPGKYPYVRDKEKYVLCIPNTNRGVVVAYRMECPKKTVFSNILRRCISKEMWYNMAW